MSYIGQAAASGQILFSSNDINLHGFGTLEGDVINTLKRTIVSGIGGYPIETNGPQNGDSLVFQTNQWTLSAPTASPHNLLSSTHADTEANAAIRGDIIFASGATPVWTRIARGAPGYVLRSNGTEVEYTQLGQNTPHESGTSAAPGVTFRDDLNTGWYTSEADKMSATAGGTRLMTFNGASGSISLEAGRVVKVRDSVNATVTSADYIIAVINAPATITLPAPAAVPSGMEVIVKDKNGLVTGSNRITIDGNGYNIDGNATITISQKYGAFTLVNTGAAWNIM